MCYLLFYLDVCVLSFTSPLLGKQSDFIPLTQYLARRLCFQMSLQNSRHLWSALWLKASSFHTSPEHCISTGLSSSKYLHDKNTYTAWAHKAQVRQTFIIQETIFNNKQEKWLISIICLKHWWHTYWILLPRSGLAFGDLYMSIPYPVPLEHVQLVKTSISYKEPSSRNPRDVWINWPWYPIGFQKMSAWRINL